MARGKGTANLAASLEVLAGAPLDARDICPTVADLYVAANWTYKYIGMKTTVQATGDTYRLVNLDVTQESSWVIDNGGSEVEANPTGTAMAELTKIRIGDAIYSIPSGGSSAGFLNISNAQQTVLNNMNNSQDYVYDYLNQQ